MSEISSLKFACVSMLELVCYKSAEFGDSTIVIAQCPHYEIH